MNTTAAIILAAGRGTRMNSTDVNKVMLPLSGKPMLSYTVEHLKSAGVSQVLLVVGFAKDSIVNYFNDTVSYAEQTEQLGTAHALSSGLRALPAQYETIISMYGDDSYIYPPALYQQLLTVHREKQADMTVLTVIIDDPTGLGRIIRNDTNKVVAIVEEKDATSEQKLIHEINTGLYVFNRSFLEEFIPQISNNNASHEYYITDILSLAIAHNKTVASVRESSLKWRGVNTAEELTRANEQFTS